VARLNLYFLCRVERNLLQ